MILEVPPALDGKRLDKALADLLGISRAIAKELVSLGVSVDEKPARANTRVAGGSLISTPVPPEKLALQPEQVDFEVLYEDQNLIVVNKHPGLVVHPGAGQPTGTLAAGLLYRYPDILGVGAPGRWGLVHRLDKGTSGALLVGRDQASFEKLSAALRAREVTREYVALVEGTIRPPTGSIDAPIGRDQAQPTRRAVTPDGKRARTHYQVVKNYEDDNVALVDVQLETGRTHQIRVHFAAIGHPVVGDRVYGTGSFPVESPRVFLHAGRLTFAHPGSGEEMVVEAPLPPDLQEVVDRLGQRGEE